MGKLDWKLGLHTHAQKASTKQHSNVYMQLENIRQLFETVQFRMYLLFVDTTKYQQKKKLKVQNISTKGNKIGVPAPRFELTARVRVKVL